MKKLLLISSCCLFLGACGAFHTKQPINDTYYKKTQSVAWPGESTSSFETGVPTASISNGSIGGGSNGSHSSVGGSVGSADPKAVGDKWSDATAPAPEVAVPKVPEKKIQCTKKGDAYTCRYGQTVCGKGCKSDGSNCSYGYCLKSECDDVMGQKWDWVKVNTDNDPLYGCKHPSYNVYCFPHGSYGILCSPDRYYFHYCGAQCNKNGTDCGEGDNNCWDKYR